MALMNSKKSIGTLVLSLVLAAAVSATAFADDAKQAPVFPMKADVFQQHVEQGITRHKAHLEQRITEKKIDDAKAKEMRDHFDAKVVQIRAAVATATADGVVTKEEAQTVRQTEGWHRHHDAKAPAQNG